MSRILTLVSLSSLALVAAIILGMLPIQTTDDLQEVSRVPTVCALPIVLPRFNTSLLQINHLGKGQTELEVPITFEHPSIDGLGTLVEYNVTLKPMNDWNATARKMATSRTDVHCQAAAVVRFAIPQTEVPDLMAWELDVSADAEPNIGHHLGSDRVYVSFTKAASGDVAAVVRTPADYWYSKMLDLKYSNFTLSPFEHQEDQRCTCDKKTWIPQQLRLIPNGPDLPILLLPFPISNAVVYEDPNGLDQALSNAMVGLYDDFNTQRPPDWTFRLDSRGRADTVIVTRVNRKPVAAKVFLDDELFTMKQGPDTGNLNTWEFDLTVSNQDSTISVTGKIPQAIGPDLGHVWSEWHRIRSNGENLVGLDGIPHIDVWFPSSGTSSWYWDNLIALLSDRSRLPEVYAHEYGHHVMHTLMRGGIPTGWIGDHTFCSTNANDILSWVEGYATAFGLRVLGLRSYRGLDLEALSCPVNRDMRTSEGRVAAGLLDLMDDEGASPECSGTNPDLGRPGLCDRTRNTLFTPYTVLRWSIVGPQLSSVVDWWNRLATALRGQPGIADGWEAMRYNYYPLPPCRLRWRGFCLDVIRPGIVS